MGITNNSIEPFDPKNSPYKFRNDIGHNVNND